MNKMTKNLIAYVLIFFLFLILVIGGFFSYKIFFSTDDEVDFSVLEVDQEYQDLLNKIEQERINRLKNRDIQYEEFKDEPCYLDNKEYPDGSKTLFYSRPSVGAYESCLDFSKEKICDNGVWLGDKKFKYTFCKRSLDCVISKDKSIADGEDIYLYSRNRVAYGDDCERYKKKRSCVESILTGPKEYIYENCSVILDGVCRIKDENGEEHIIPNNRSRVFYSTLKVPYNKSCTDYSQQRMCSGGVLYGDKEYKYWECKKAEPKDCSIDGVTIKHGSSRVLYSKTNAQGIKTCNFYSQIRTCQDGVLDGQEEYVHANCQD